MNIHKSQFFSIYFWVHKGTNVLTHTMWLVLWNISCFSIYWEEYSQLTFIFFRGVGIPPTRISWTSLRCLKRWLGHPGQVLWCCGSTVAPTSPAAPRACSTAHVWRNSLAWLDGVRNSWIGCGVRKGWSFLAQSLVIFAYIDRTYTYACIATLQMYAYKLCVIYKFIYTYTLYT